MSKYFKDKTLLNNFIKKLGKARGVKTITKHLVDVLGDSGVYYCHDETSEQLEKDYKWLMSCTNIDFNKLYISELENYSKFVR